MMAPGFSIRVEWREAVFDGMSTCRELADGIGLE